MHKWRRVVVNGALRDAVANLAANANAANANSAKAAANIAWPGTDASAARRKNVLPLGLKQRKT